MDTSRIGVFLPCLHQPSIEEGLAKAEEMGFAYVQSPQSRDCANTLGDWQAFLKSAEKHNLIVSALSGYRDFANPDGLEERIAEMKQDIDFAQELPRAIVCTESGGAMFAAGEQKEKEWATLVESMKELADYAGQKGAYLAMEPGGSGLVATAESMAQLIADVDNPRLKYNIDPANITMYGSDAVRAAKEVGKHVIHAHAKDAAFYYALTPEIFAKVAGKFKTLDDIAGLLGKDTPPVDETPLGEGQVQWAEYLKALEEAGYDGPHIIEREAGDNFEADIAAGKKFLETL